MRKMLLLLVAALMPCQLATAQSFTRLGDLPGGSFNSVALGVSGDGSTVVGYSVGTMASKGFVGRVV